MTEGSDAPIFPSRWIAANAIEDVDRARAGKHVRLSTEWIWAALLLAVGVGLRLAWVTLFPTIPISDFRAIVDFAVAFSESVSPQGVWQWQQFNAGMPMALSVLFRMGLAPPEEVARYATAIVTGVLPLIPYFVWRDVVRFRIRVLVALLLALWPAQIFFSGVVAQDNFVLLPTVALAALAVRALTRRDEGWPLLSAFLFVFAAATRQEMLIALLPVAVAAAGALGEPQRRRWRRAALWAAATAVLLVALAWQRWEATGRFALTSEHRGRAVLGAYVPGAGIDYWTDPNMYVASVEPALLQNPAEYQRQALRLALKEALRRPRFHLVRMIASTAAGLGGTGSAVLYWSLGDPGTLPPSLRTRADAFARRAYRPLNLEVHILHLLFLASLMIGIWRRSWPILLLTLPIALKIALHAILVGQARYFFPVLALEILVVALGSEEAIKLRSPRTVGIALAGAVLGVVLLGIAGKRAEAFVLTHDENVQRTYRFSLTDPGRHGILQCMVDQGTLTALTEREATIRPFHADPSPGEAATAVCRLRGTGGGASLDLEVMDPYAPGGLPDRILQSVMLDRQEIIHHDLAADPGAGWLKVSLGRVGAGTARDVEIRVLAVRPDAGAAWGAAARTTFRLAASETK